MKRLAVSLTLIAVVAVLGALFQAIAGFGENSPPVHWGDRLGYVFMLQLVIIPLVVVACSALPPVQSRVRSLTGLGTTVVCLLAIGAFAHSEQRPSQYGWRPFSTREMFFCWLLVACVPVLAWLVCGGGKRNLRILALAAGLAAPAIALLAAYAASDPYS